MTQYSKLIAAVVGILILILYKKTGIDLTAESAQIVDLVIAAVTAISVWAVPNKPKE